jgi:uncharacterized protein YkwD
MRGRFAKIPRSGVSWPIGSEIKILRSAQQNDALRDMMADGYVVSARLPGGQVRLRARRADQLAATVHHIKRRAVRADMPARRSGDYRGDRRRRGPRVLGVVVACVAVVAVGYLATATTARILRATGIATVSSNSGCPSALPGCPQPASLANPTHPAVPPATRAGTIASTASPSPSPSHLAGTSAATRAPAAAVPAVRQVLKMINRARAQAGQPGYTITAGLRLSSARHDNRMAHGCGLSHQCPGEPPLGARETAAGVPWTTAGENIGEGGPAASTPAAIIQMALTLTRDMLDEKPPDDGHRQNLLEPAFHHIGIAIYRDSSGTVWMTQDFAN